MPRCLQPNFARAIIASVTVIAPPMRVAVWAKGMRDILFAVSRIATSPAPPLLQRQQVTMARSIGYIFNQRATRNPVAVMAATVATMVRRLGRAHAASNLSQGVIARLFVKITG